MVLRGTQPRLATIVFERSVTGAVRARAGGMRRAFRTTGEPAGRTRGNRLHRHDGGEHPEQQDDRDQNLRARDPKSVCRQTIHKVREILSRGQAGRKSRTEKHAERQYRAVRGADDSIKPGA